MAKSGMTLTGVAELDRALTNLERKLQKKIARFAVNKSLTVIAKGIKSEVPPSWKSIRKSIGKRNKKNKRRNLHEAKAGVNVAKKRGKQAHHAHLLALGTKERFHKDGSGPFGKIEPNDFVERGTRKALPDAEDRLKESLWEGIAKEARRNR